ncbi:hypothetical protein JCM31598_13560 [Desulfonatronum parangueonense]
MPCLIEQLLQDVGVGICFEEFKVIDDGIEASAYYEAYQGNLGRRFYISVQDTLNLMSPILEHTPLSGRGNEILGFFRFMPILVEARHDPESDPN